MQRHSSISLHGASKNANSKLERKSSKIDIDDQIIEPGNGIFKASTGFSNAGADEVPENIGVFLRFEVKNGLFQYQNLCRAVQKLKDAIDTMAEARLELSEALKSISACRCTNVAGAQENPFKLCSEIFRTMSLKERDLAEVLSRDIEKPMKKNLETHSSKVQSTDRHYVDMMKKLNDSIRSLEKKCNKSAKKNPEDYPKHLTELNSKGSELEKVKQNYMQSALDEERRNFSFLAQKFSLLLKSEIQVLSENSKDLSSKCSNLLQLAFGVGDEPLPKELLELFGGMDPSQKVPLTPLNIVAENIVNTKRTSITSESNVANAVKSLMTSSSKEGTEKVNEITRSLSQSSVAKGSVDVGSPQEIKVSTQKNEDSKEYLKILHNFEARQTRELSVSKNDVVQVKKRDNNWIYVTKDGKSGWIPKAFAKAMVEE